MKEKEGKEERENNDYDRQIIERGCTTHFLSTHAPNNISTYNFVCSFARPLVYQLLCLLGFTLEK